MARKRQGNQRKHGGLPAFADLRDEADGEVFGGERERLLFVLQDVGREGVRAADEEGGLSGGAAAFEDFAGHAVGDLVARAQDERVFAREVGVAADAPLGLPLDLLERAFEDCVGVFLVGDLTMK